jgi:hypothetical protein
VCTCQSCSAMPLSASGGATGDGDEASGFVGKRARVV